jgi:hypothetical protein
MRVGRDASDKRLPDADHWRRYRCQNPTCGWEGLRPVTRRHRNHLEVVERVPVALRVGVSALALMIIAGLTWGGFQVLQHLFEP